MDDVIGQAANLDIYGYKEITMDISGFMRLLQFYLFTVVDDDIHFYVAVSLFLAKLKSLPGSSPAFFWPALFNSGNRFVFEDFSRI